MRSFLSGIQIILGIVLMAVILLQHRKQGGFAGIFGGGTQAEAGQWQRFTGLTKLTVIISALFMVSSFILVMMSK
jgi:preprotein translocase subunit SecG